METKLTRKQVYKKYNIDTEKQKFLDDTPLDKIIEYEEFNKSLRKKKGYFDKIFPPYNPNIELIKKYDQRCKKCQKTENWEIWKNCFNEECYPQNKEGAMFKSAYGYKEWISWKTLK